MSQPKSICDFCLFGYRPCCDWIKKKKKKRLYGDVCVVAVNVLLDWNKNSEWLLIAVLSLVEEDSSQINKLILH